MLLTLACSALALGGAGCFREDMHDQPRNEAYEASDFFADGKSSRPLVAGTIAFGSLGDARLIAAAGDGTDLGKSSDIFPFPITRADLQRGQERFNIYCMPCHGGLGDGKGMIVQRGFTPPPTFHQDRLRKAPAGHFVTVMTNGFGAMYSYADRIDPADRWRIAAYIRALQLSQDANATMLEPAEALKATSQAAHPAGHETENPSVENPEHEAGRAH